MSGVMREESRIPELGQDGREFPEPFRGAVVVVHALRATMARRFGCGKGRETGLRVCHISGLYAKLYFRSMNLLESLK